MEINRQADQEDEQMALAELKTDAMQFLSTTRLSNVEAPDGTQWLQIPGHSPHVIAAAKPVRDPFEVRLTKRSNSKFYEETTTLLISHLLSRFKPDVFFDLGAGVSYFSFVAASHIASSPTAHAFEMQPRSIEIINNTAATVTVPGTVESHLSGLSDVHLGMKRIWYARTKMFEQEPPPSEYREPWWIRLKFALQGTQSKRSTLFSADVLLTSLDHFCEQRGVVPGLVKIDVDGYEGKVLRGAERMLRELQPIVLLELHKDAKQRFGILRADCVEMLFDAGYEALFITEHHDAERCELVEVGRGHPYFARSKTDMVLFFPPRILNG